MRNRNDRPIKAVLWDLDGTLIQSEAVHMASIRHASAKYGRVIEDDFIMPPGSNGPDLYRSLFGLPASKKLSEDYENWYCTTTEYVVANITTTSPANSAVDFCKWLATAGVAQSLVSNSSRPIIEAALRHIGIRNCFHHLCSGDEVHRAKPAPDVYLRALHLHGLTPDDCLAFENSLFGVKAAGAASIPVVALSDDMIVRKHADLAISPCDASAWSTLQCELTFEKMNGDRWRPPDPFHIA